MDTAAVTRKLGPLPVWAWGAGLGGGVLAWRWYQARQAAASDTSQTQAPGQATDQGISASGPGGYYDPAMTNGSGLVYDPTTGMYVPGGGGAYDPYNPYNPGGATNYPVGPQGPPGAPGKAGPSGSPGHAGCDAGTHWDSRRKKCVKNPKCHHGHHWDATRKKCVRTGAHLASDNLGRQAARPGARTGAPGPAVSSGHVLTAPRSVARSAPVRGPRGQDRFQHASPTGVRHGV